MNSIVITWTQLLYISLVLILFYAAELLLFLRKSSQNKTRDPDMRKLLAEQREQMQDLQREIENLKVRLATVFVQQHSGDVVAPSKPVSAAAKDADSPYSQAIRLAQLGDDADKVAAQCGISRGEADLIVALYRTGTLH